MRSIRISSRRIFSAAAAFVVGVSVALPALVSAAQVTQRSMTLSSASVDAENVTYTVNFTSVSEADAMVIDFCSNTPLIGQACTAPADLDVSEAVATTSGFTVNGTATTANHLVVDGTIDAATPIEVEFTGIDNPSVDGSMYARIVTFDTTVNAGNAAPQTLTGLVDEGSVALAIHDTISVSGVVLETLTFCVSGALIEDACETTVPPTVELGVVTGDITALTSGVISQGSIHTQISTNASNGAVIRLKSNALECGGLLRAGAAAGTCDILPANDANGISEGDSKFGVRTAAAATNTVGSTNFSGTLVPADGSLYNSTDFFINYVDGDATGVTSTFGDPFLDTDGDPVNAKNMQVTFGATVNDNTPAGAYSADLSLIAVGRF